MNVLRSRHGTGEGLLVSGAWHGDAPGADGQSSREPATLRRERDSRVLAAARCPA